MKSPNLLEVLELDLTGMPACFTACELETRASAVLEELHSLLRLDGLLQNTELACCFRVKGAVAAGGLVLVAGLRPSRQLVLDLAQLTDSTDAQRAFADDFDRLVSACRRVHSDANEVILKFSYRVRAGCLDAQQEPLPQVARDWVAHFARRRTLPRTAQLVGVECDLPMAASPPVDWCGETMIARVRVVREKEGYTFKALRLAKAPRNTNCGQTIRIPAFPVSLEDRRRLDEVSHTGQCVDVRFRPGKDLLGSRHDIGDFIAFA